MCGIAGFIDNTRNVETLEQMVCTLIKRGPDDSGVFFKDGVGLAHRRLSIIDLSESGHQPMFFEDMVIVYNGEVYNYKEIQVELVKKGYQFVSSTDTEVVLKAFHCWGPNCVSKFIGMFAFAIYNQSEKTLYIFRDRAGVKPLYYYFKNNKLAFASELKSIKPYLSNTEKDELDVESISQFLALGYISDEKSIISSIKKLKPAHYLEYKDGNIKMKQYWEISFQENKEWLQRKEEDILDELDELIVSSFKYRMIADVPVGIFLSSGVDSSLVTAVLSKNFEQIKTFTIGLDDKKHDESNDARKIANYLNSDHTEGILTADKAYKILDEFYDIYDEPHGDNGCVPNAYVAELAKSKGVKVVLSADGGDELFGGYTRYKDYLKRWHQLKKIPGTIKWLGGIGLKSISTLTKGENANRYSRFADVLSQKDFIHFYQTIIRSTSTKALIDIFPGYTYSFSEEQHGDYLDQMCEWDFKHYMVDDILMKVDRASMHYSIECREPFLDYRLVEFAAQLPLKYKIRDGETKYLLKKLLTRYLPKKLYDFPKRGFGAPLQLWIRDHYKEQFEVVLNNIHPLFDKKSVNQLISKHQKGLDTNYILLWHLFSFQSWYNRWSAK